VAKKFVDELFVNTEYQKAYMKELDNYLNQFGIQIEKNTKM